MNANRNITSQNVKKGMWLTDEYNQDCRVEGVQHNADGSVSVIFTKRFDRVWWDGMAKWSPVGFDARTWRQIEKPARAKS